MIEAVKRAWANFRGFDLTGRPIGEPWRLEQIWGRYHDDKNWEGLDWTLDGTSLVLAHDEKDPKRHRALATYILTEMTNRGATSWSSPDPSLRCAIATVNIPAIKMPDMELALWKQDKIRIRGAAPSKVRLSTPYYLRKSDIDRFLAAFDAYRKAPAA